MDNIGEDEEGEEGDEGEGEGDDGEGEGDEIEDDRDESATGHSQSLTPEAGAIPLGVVQGQVGQFFNNGKKRPAGLAPLEPINTNGTGQNQYYDNQYDDYD